MDLYAQNVLDRYKNPFYKDQMIESNVKHKESNPLCGDMIEAQLLINDDLVKKYTFTGQGCAISMASADMLGDLIIDQKISDIFNLNKEDVYEVLGIEISYRRSKCALLALLAIQNAILKYQKKPLWEWEYLIND